jgi:ADP-ribose pyrophosphatase YjhB (NUDIX family)/predicted GIY-YIG superfamily endonuclease
LYCLRCTDDTLYTGVTTDVERRLAEHNAGRGARYTAGRRPVHLIGVWQFAGRGDAQRAEAQFRRFPRSVKRLWAAQRMPFEGAPFCWDAFAGEAADAPRRRYCPHCGGLLTARVLAEGTRARQVCSVCGRVDYRNAKPCAGALIVRDERVLLLRRAIEPARGCWDIPGGFLEEDEAPQAGVIREVREETGLAVEGLELLGFYLDRYGERGDYCLNIYFVARPAEGDVQIDAESSDWAWFGVDDWPEDLAFAHERTVLADWARRVRRRTSGEEERAG